jgi:hypothetical protein
VTALLLALALLAPPGVHYQGVQGTGATAPPAGGISTIARTNGPYTNVQNSTVGTTIAASGVAYGSGDVVVVGLFLSYSIARTAHAVAPTISGGTGLSWGSAVAPSYASATSNGTTCFFVATAASAQTGQTITVTYENANGDTMWNWVEAEAFSGVKTAAPTGATGIGYNAASQTASVTVDSSGTGRQGSYIAMVAGNFSNTRGAVDGNSTLVVEDNGTVTNGWVQKRSALVNAGSYTLTRAINTSNDLWVASGIELVAQGN